MIKNKPRFILGLILLLVCMGVMFQASNTPYKQQDMKPMLKRHIHLTPKSFPEAEIRYAGDSVSNDEPYEFLEFIIRKSGHVTEYMILTLLFLMTLMSTNVNRKAAVLFSFIGSFLFACSDEWHQSFIQGRTGHFIDVYTFDMSGMILGMLIFGVVLLVMKRK
ncbi:VanZ family protein [Falsibacillus albus]|uniref:VanZ-like domain-containing protein n=1 Tax=Falsibacillus albus TaxID=2478915 RepID=A0A3L7JYV1_9BACI|nr:VanZ family protein [Falsibacillus albus]RLQ94891.1 hypothetical protein D9X91_12985 [Falsibacillus albus]